MWGREQSPKHFSGLGTTHCRTGASISEVEVASCRDRREAGGRATRCWIASARGPPTAKAFAEVVAAQDPEERARLERDESLHYIEPMKSHANDGKHWSENDVRNLMASLRCGDTIEEAAERLCRSGTIDEVRRKAEELGLKYKSSG